MPKGLKRYYGAGDLHFITTSCYERRPLLNTALRRDLLLRVLECMRQRYRFVVVGYVVMPEHIHLLISEPQRANPSIVMQALKLGFARRVVSPSGCARELGGTHVSQKARDVGHPARDLGHPRIWQHRFYDFNVWTERKRIEKLRYMHRNPVTRGLVSEPDQWQWSSFRSYAYGEPGLVRINDWQLLEMRRSPAV